jgi:phosphoribosylanthranilate isomerase
LPLDPIQRLVVAAPIEEVGELRRDRSGELRLQRGYFLGSALQLPEMRLRIALPGDAISDDRQTLPQRIGQGGVNGACDGHGVNQLNAIAKLHSLQRASAKPPRGGAGNRPYPLPAILPHSHPRWPGAARGLVIKICGLTHPADAELALELGADALGLNFYPKSPRCLDPAADAAWLRALPSATCRIAVLVNPALEEIERLLGEGLVDAIQLHGDEDEAFCLSLAERGVPFIKAIRLRDENDLAALGRYHTADLLVDSYQPGAYGGTGRQANWELAARLAASQRETHRTLLSGGLNPGNVAAAIRQVRPDGVDVASGVEGPAGPRRKDAGLLRDFFLAVRRYGSD